MAVGGDGAVAPESDVDPFCAEFFEDPFPAHRELRDLGPVVRLSRYGVWAVARWAEVHRVLNDWQSFVSSRGVGLTDFAKEEPWRPPSLVLEADPPLHDRARRVLERVLAPAVMRGLRERFARTAEALCAELAGRGTIDAVADFAEAYPLTVFPDAMGMARENRRFLLPYGNMAFNAFGPRNAFFAAAFAEAEPVLAWIGAQMQRAAFARGGFGAAIHAAVDEGQLSAEEAPLLARSPGSTRRSATSAPRSGASPAFPSNSRGCAPIRRWRGPPSTRQCATRARCRPSFARRAGRSRSAACRSARARRC